jgi:hypothetical protein
MAEVTPLSVPLVGLSSKPVYLMSLDQTAYRLCFSKVSNIHCLPLTPDIPCTDGGRCLERRDIRTGGFRVVPTVNIRRTTAQAKITGFYRN